MKLRPVVSLRTVVVKGFLYTLYPLALAFSAAAVAGKELAAILVVVALPNCMTNLLAFLNQDLSDHKKAQPEPTSVEVPNPQETPPAASVGPSDAPLTAQDVQGVARPSEYTGGMQ